MNSGSVDRIPHSQIQKGTVSVCIGLSNEEKLFSAHDEQFLFLLG